MPSARALLPIVALLTFSLPAPAAEKVDFARDIRPILSNACFKCHGPAVQKSKLRLDTRAGAARNNAIVPGKPGDSALLDRVGDPNDDARMPPADSGQRLKPEQIAKLKAWIEQGAEH